MVEEKSIKMSEFLEFQKKIASMSFRDALKKLNIEDYHDRIWSSNSHGELFHLTDYIAMAISMENTNWFREAFIDIVQWAEETWERPQSVYQHIFKLLQEAATRK